MTGGASIRHPGPVPNLQQLRDGGPESLSSLMALRPDVLSPAVPRSLIDLGQTIIDIESLKPYASANEDSQPG